ncbi:MAG TPA: cob(I)yrinic acid a,c-diamide adenosyltransferase [Acidiferrobacterales bacterium]|nr:cob(I)yrinic acid a,c-diamide adenosyltransferase [Acidiferrobacterales bacterium]
MSRERRAQAFFRRFPEVDDRVMGEGFTWETQDRARDIAAAQAAWHKAADMLAGPALQLVLLDELNIALKRHYLAMDDVIAALQARPPMQHVIVTGRAAGTDRYRRHRYRNGRDQARLRRRHSRAERHRTAGRTLRKQRRKN